MKANKVKVKVKVKVKTKVKVKFYPITGHGVPNGE